jgi:3-oxoacyl-[acyl-carrier-protein] synthase I
MLSHHFSALRGNGTASGLVYTFPAPTSFACLKPLVLSRCATANPLGLGCEATLAALRENRTGLRPNDFETARLDTWIGRVDGVEKEPIAAALTEFDCRNNRLAQLGLRQDGFEDAVAGARERYGPHRIAVLIGTSTSGIHETELAYRRRDPVSGALPPGYSYRHSQNVYSVAAFVRGYLGLAGPGAAISTACSSSAKVFASAHRLIEAGFADAAVVGGVDSLCLTTLYGFGSLELLSREPCRPCDAARDGISIGEAAGFVLLERPERAAAAVALLGYGESSDGYHMSAPHPEGAGVHRAMSDALARAGVAAREIDYINLHGTATPANDRAEDAAIHRIFGDATPCSSTKGWTGHALGAAGIVEAIISALCLEHGFVPGSLNTRNLDPSFRSRVVLRAEERPLRRVLSNSFGFGGNNCSLVFGATGR